MKTSFKTQTRNGIRIVHLAVKICKERAFEKERERKKKSKHASSFAFLAWLWGQFRICNCPITLFGCSLLLFLTILNSSLSCVCVLQFILAALVQAQFKRQISCPICIRMAIFITLTKVVYFMLQQFIPLYTYNVKGNLKLMMEVAYLKD